MDRLVRILAGLSLIFLLTATSSAMAKGWHKPPERDVEHCSVLPFALPQSLIETLSPEEQVKRASLKTGAGNIGWLSWDKRLSLIDWLQSIFQPTQSSVYRDLVAPRGIDLQPGSWIAANPGVKNSAAVRRAMDGLIGQEIRVPIYDITSGKGAWLRYRFAGFALIRLDAYRLSGKGWISFTYLGDGSCQPNQPPQIVSEPLLSATTGEWYHYPVEAIDPNEHDVIRYSLPQGPAGMQVDSVSGELSWQVTDTWQGNHLESNDFCFAPGQSASVQNPGADVVVVVDESGSMSGEHAWIKDLAMPLEAHLISNGIGSGEHNNLYGLLGFERAPRPIMMDGGLMGRWDVLREAADGLQLYGGTEDGWRAIRYALGDYPLREQSAKNIILITDEGRDIVDSGISYASLLAELKTAGAILNAVVNARFECTDSQGARVSALGMDAEGAGYLADGQGGYLTCSDAKATWGHTNTVNTLDAYVPLALETGGAAWDLNYLRAGGMLARSFTAALMDIKVREILEHLPPRPLADLSLLSIREKDNNIEVVAGNRGLVDVTQTLEVRLLDPQGDIYAVQSLDGLGAQEYQTLRFSIPDTIAASLAAEIIAVDGEVEECGVANNQLAIPWITVRAEDQGGLYDEQRFTLGILTANRVPQIISEPVRHASAGAMYHYQVIISDPDSGDAHRYELVEAPQGMSIDTVSGKIRFFPNAGQIGEHTVQVRVIDLAGESDTQAYIVNVGQDYTRPRISSEPLLRAVQGMEYRYHLMAQADPQASISYAVLFGPSGMQVDNDGQLNWNVPSALADTQVEVVVRVRDQYGNYDLQFFTLRIDSSNAAPVIHSEPDSWVELGNTWQYVLMSEDPDGDPVTIALRAGPAGMVLDSATAQFSWQPTQSHAEPVSVVIEVSDPFGASTEQAFTIKVYDGPNQPPVFQSTPETQAWVGLLYVYGVQVSDPDGDPLQLDLQSAPEGVVWDAQTRQLTWQPQPEQLGTHTFVMLVSDPRGGSATQSFTVEVALPNQPPVFTSMPPTHVESGRVYRYFALAEDPDGDALSYHLLEAPAGALLNGTSGELIWLAAEPGQYTFILQVQDGRGGVAEQAFQIQVEEPAPLPSLCNTPLAP